MKRPYAMPKGGEKSTPAKERKLRKRIAIRICVLWKESNYSPKLEKYALKAVSYLKEIGKIKEEDTDHTDQ